MTVNADAAETDINAARRCDGARDGRKVGRVWKYFVFIGHAFIGIQSSIELAFHKAAETQRMIGGHPAAVRPAVFIHIKHNQIPAVDGFDVADPGQAAVLSRRSDGKDERRAPSLMVIGADRIGHDPRKVVGRVLRGWQDFDCYRGSLAEPFGRHVHRRHVRLVSFRCSV